MAGFGLAYFVQRYLDLPDKLRRPIAAGGVMSVPKNEKYKDYVRYAEHCLNVMTETTDQESRSIQRDMVVDWLRLADSIRHPLKSWQIRPLKHRKMSPLDP